MNPLEQAKIEYQLALKELSDRINEMFEETQLNSEKLIIKLQSSKRLIEELKKNSYDSNTF